MSGQQPRAAVAAVSGLGVRGPALTEAPASPLLRLDHPLLLPPVLRLLHTALDGTVESFVNIWQNVSERLDPRRPEPFAARNLAGKVAIVTGGNAGIGFATAQQLARRGAHVVIACRDPERAQAAVRRIAATTTPLFPSSPALPAAAAEDAAAAGGGAGSVRVEAMPLDLGRLASVREFAEAWRRRGLPLHLLVCNAGLMGPPQRLETADGLEMQFQVNFLSHWLLANQLVAAERQRRAASARGGKAVAGAAAKGAGWQRAVAAVAAVPGGSGGSPAEELGDGLRVVMVTWLTHRAGALQWADKQSRASYEPFLSYGLSKLANVMTAAELQRRRTGAVPRAGRASRNPCPHGGAADAAVSVHPGLVATHLANGFFTARGTGWAAGGPLQPAVEAAVSGFGALAGPLLMRTPEQSAGVMLHACLAPRREVAGRYLALGRVASPDPAAEHPGLAAELWAYAQQLTDYRSPLQ